MTDTKLMALAREIRQKAIDQTIKQLEQNQSLISSVNTQNGQPSSPDDVVDGMRPQIEAEFSDIPELFAPFADMPTASGFDGMVKSLTDVLAKLSTGDVDQKNPADGHFYAGDTVLDQYQSVQRSVANWTGQAARAFNENFMDHFITVTRNQYLLASSLKGALDGEQKLWSEARSTIYAIANNTITSLDNLDAACTSTALTITFTVVGCIVSVVGAPLGDEPAVAVAIAGVASQLLGSAVPQPPQSTYPGNDAATIVDGMRSAIGTLKGYIRDEEQKIATAMASNHSLVDAPPQPNTFCLPAPQLANATPSTIAGYMGDAT